MKKLLISALACFLLSSISFADCSCKNKPDCGCSKPSCERKTDCVKENTCSKCSLDDDEYCIYNQCYLDKHYTKMKKALCLTRQQEACIDVLYKNFKADLENQHAKYRTEKNKLLEMIECDNDCYKEQVKTVKAIGKETKEKAKQFRSDVKEQLCKNQYSDFRKFQRAEKRKMKKIVKYGKIIKLPCSECCN